MTQTTTHPTVAASADQPAKKKHPMATTPPASEPTAVGAQRPSVLSSAVTVFSSSMRTVVFAILAFMTLACAWRGLDIYERNSQAVAVHARIEMERHEAWKAAVRERQQAITASELSKEATAQVKGVPSLDVEPPGSPAAAAQEAGR